jgi:hypothetical protein
MKKLTYEQLERNRNGWIVCSLVLIVFFLFVVSSYVSDVNYLQTQLEECQNYLPEYNLKVMCYFDLEDRIVLVESNFTDYEYYIDSKDFYEEHEYCEVIK